jgi:hypothetical protein
MSQQEFLFRLVRCIAPTIAGIKPATLMNISVYNGGLPDVWDYYKKNIFNKSVINYYELKRTDKNVIVLFFNYYQLSKLLRKKPVREFLCSCGYESYSIERVLNMLEYGYTCQCPPEIGIFLGIPLKDVKGFMGLNSLQNTKRGMWKIYGDPTVSENLMNNYRNAKNIIIERLFNGEDPIDIITSINNPSLK